MSFSKARIQRFNELENDVPPPGAYDPKLDSKVRGLVIEKSERFHDSKSVGSAECNLSTRGKDAVQVSAGFRTPQLPRRKREETPKTGTTAAKSSRTLHGTASVPKLKYDSRHQLADLQVECSNKDRTIQEMEKYIEEMKEDVQRLESEVDELRGKQAEAEERHRQDKARMAKLQADVLSDCERKHQAEAENLRSQLFQELAEKEREVEEWRKKESELKGRVADLEAELSDKIAYYVDRVRELEVDAEEARESHRNEVDSLRLNNRELSARGDQLNADLQASISTYESKLNEMRVAHQDFLRDATKNLNDVKERYEVDLRRLGEHYRKEKDAIREEMEREMESKVIAFGKERDRLERELEAVRAACKDLTMARDKEIAEMEAAAAKKIEEETKRIRQRADRRVEDAEAVTRETLAACRAECEERVKRAMAEAEAKVNARNEEANAAAEKYEARLARLETERAMLQGYVADKDAEISKLSVAVEELKSSVETQESFGQSLQMELDRTETELAEKKDELRTLKNQMREEAAEMVARKKRLEVVVGENKASVAALTSRLIQCDAEAERLQLELKRERQRIREHRDLLCTMRDNTKVVQEQMHVLVQELQAKRELVDQREADSLNELESVRKAFAAKIDDLNATAVREVGRLKADVNVKTVENAEMRQQLDEMAGQLVDAQTMLLRLEEANDAKEVEISRLELEKRKVERQGKMQEAALHEANRAIEELRSRIENLQRQRQQEHLQEEAMKRKRKEEEQEQEQEKEEEERKMKAELVEQMEKKWQSLENMLTERLEKEKAAREAAEEEVKKLAERNKSLARSNEEISEKYAEVVGHHNHKQRIKHVSQLKTKISQLEQDLIARNRLVEQQQRALEKYKSEERRGQIRGKENLFGNAKSAHTTPVSSPNKLLTPLRSRND